MTYNPFAECSSIEACRFCGVFLDREARAEELETERAIEKEREKRNE